MAESLATRLRALVWDPTDAIRLRAFTWLLTWALLIYTLAWARHGAEWLTADGFHPRGAAMAGQQLDLGPLPAGAHLWVLVPYVGAMVIVILGVARRAPRVERLALGVVFAGLLVVTGIDRLSAFTFNKLAIVSYATLLFIHYESAAPGHAGRVRSAWPLRVLQATIVLQFFGAGVCKLRGDWWAHSDTLWMQVQGAFRTDAAAWLMGVVPKPAWGLLQWLALGFELAAPVLLTVGRLRPLAFVWGGGMLLMIGLTMAQVGYFAFMIGTFFVLFVDPDRLAAISERWK